MHFADLSGVSALITSLPVEENLATHTCWGYHHILDIGVFLFFFLTKTLRLDSLCAMSVATVDATGRKVSQPHQTSLFASRFMSIWADCVRDCAN